MRIILIALLSLGILATSDAKACCDHDLSDSSSSLGTNNLGQNFGTSRREYRTSYRTSSSQQGSSSISTNQGPGSTCAECPPGFVRQEAPQGSSWCHCVSNTGSPIPQRSEFTTRQRCPPGFEWWLNECQESTNINNRGGLRTGGFVLRDRSRVIQRPQLKSLNRGHASEQSHVSERREHTRVTQQREEQQQEVTQCGPGLTLVGGRCKISQTWDLEESPRVEVTQDEQHRVTEVDRGQLEEVQIGSRATEVNTQREEHSTQECTTGLSTALGRCGTQVWDISGGQPRVEVTQREHHQVSQRVNNEEEQTQITPCRPGFTMVNGWCEMTRTYETPTQSRVEVREREQHRVTQTNQFDQHQIPQSQCGPGLTSVGGRCQITQTWEFPELRESQVNEVTRREHHQVTQNVDQQQQVNQDVRRPEQPRIRENEERDHLRVMQQCGPGLTMVSGRCQISQTWDVEEQPRIQVTQREQHRVTQLGQPEQQESVNQVREVTSYREQHHQQQQHQQEVTECGPGLTSVSGRCQIDQTLEVEQPRVELTQREQHRLTQVLQPEETQIGQRVSEVSQQREHQQVQQCTTGLSTLLGVCGTQVWNISSQQQPRLEVTEREQHQVTNRVSDSNPQVTITPCRPGFTMVNGWCEMNRTFDSPIQSRVEVTRREQHQVSRTSSVGDSPQINLQLPELPELPSVNDAINRQHQQQQVREVTTTQTHDQPTTQCRPGFTMVNGWCTMRRTWEIPEQTRLSQVTQREQRRYSEVRQPETTSVNSGREVVQQPDLQPVNTVVQRERQQVSQCSSGSTSSTGRCQVTWERPARKYCVGCFCQGTTCNTQRSYDYERSQG